MIQQLIQNSSQLKQLLQRRSTPGVLVRGTVAFAITILSQLLHITSCQCFVSVTYRPLSLSLGPSFMLFLKALYYQLYLSTVFYFYDSVCLSLSTVKTLSCFSLYGFLTRASAPVCVFVTAMCILLYVCMCMNSHKKNARRNRSVRVH